MRDERVRGTHGDRQETRNGLPGRRAYVWKDRNAEPPEVTAVRERHRALNAERDRVRMDALAKAAREARERNG